MGRADLPQLRLTVAMGAVAFRSGLVTVGGFVPNGPQMAPKWPGVMECR